MRQPETIIFPLVYLPMTLFTDRDWLAVEHPQNAIEAARFPFVRQFADMANVMHHDLSVLCRLSADATRLSQFGMGSHSR